VHQAVAVEDGIANRRLPTLDEMQLPVGCLGFQMYRALQAALQKVAFQVVNVDFTA